jgi:DNA-binding NarL/FixJ family response regulator
MRVMLIEDDALVRRMISEALDADGMEVAGLAGAGGRAGAARGGPGARRPGGRRQPRAGRLSGADLAPIARERHPEVEVVLISGRQPSGYGGEPAGGGAPLRRRERFLRKPFPPEALAEAIRQAAAAAAPAAVRAEE